MKRKRWTAHQKAQVCDRQNHRCGLTGEAFMDGDAIEYDHILPLALGGPDTLDNIHAVLAAPHLAKTKHDVWRIAKAKRQQLYQQTGRSSRSRPKPILTRGFDRSKTKKFSGEVVERKHGRGLPPVRRDSGRIDLTPGAR